MPSGRSQYTDGESTDQPSPQTTATTEWIFDLPPQLENAIPFCANACISSYISQDWTSCSTNNFTCLCSDYGSEGYTLGELAFICVSLDCPNASKDQKIDAYTACASEPEAVQPTYSTLTLPTNVPTATPTTSPKTSLPQTPFHYTTSTPEPSVSAAASESSSSITSVPSTNTHSSTATAGSATNERTKESSSLTTPQAVGISVALMGALMAALGIFYLCVCIKRRKANRAKEQRRSYDFVDEEPPRVSPFNHGLDDPRGPLGGFARPRAELAEKRETQWPGHRPQDNHRYPQTHAQHYECREKDIDRSPDMKRSISPESHYSDCSMRTTSQLLPDKPSSMPPRPAAKPQPAQAFNSPETVFEEEQRPRVSGALLPGGGLPAHPAVLKTREPQFANHYTRSPEPLKLPTLSLEIPRKASGSDSFGSLGAFPLPPPRAVKPPDDAQRNSGHSRSRDSNNSLLNYYASPDCASQDDDLYSSTPIEELTQIRRPPPTAITVTKPTYPPKAVRMSTASDTSRRTSFESTDPDEPTPPEEEDKQLTPVAEVESPISGIRYPKVPRSSNQSVPRSPNYGGSPRLGMNTSPIEARQRGIPKNVPVTPEQQRPQKHSPSPSLSGSTLAAKRRGDSAAQDLEKGLRIKGSSCSQSNSQTMIPTQHQVRPTVARQNQRYESPLKGYGRVASARRDGEWPLVSTKQEMDTTAEAPMKSPLWEPKLTPRKEGDDLYLSVSAATPKAVRFHVR